MIVKEVNVPKGIRYISEWKEFSLQNYPHILDKQIPGCGFTEWTITNGMNVILACPRRILLENKRDQHVGDVHLVRNYFKELAVDKDLKPASSFSGQNSLGRDKMWRNMANDNDPTGAELANRNRGIIEKELGDYLTLRGMARKPAKILVTYDSYRFVKEFLISQGIFEEFYTVVDEFQSIFVDSRFKSDTEMGFMSALSGVKRLCYVSATPMLENYLEMLDDFKDLPYFRLNWLAEDPGRISKPSLSVRCLKTTSGVISKIVEDYRSGNFKRSAREGKDGPEIVESREVVFYINSVKGIIRAVKKNDLTPEEVNILCANTPENQRKIEKELGKGFEIGRVPLRDEPRKMFTFCTRTVYLGADMYSDNAQTVVISDSTIDTMAVDISLDLPQILGRQRLDSNPWKNKATIYIKTSLVGDKSNLEEFEDMIKEKMKETENLLNSYNLTEKDEGARSSFVRVIHRDATNTNYCFHYLGVNRHKGSTLVPEINKLAMISERRAFDIQQIDYADRFSVFNRINSVFGGEEDINREVAEFQEKFSSEKIFDNKMKLLCTAELSAAARAMVIDLVPEYFKKFYVMIGPKRCKALGYKYSNLKAEIDNRQVDIEDISKEIHSEFKAGERLLKSDIKERLGNIYQRLGLKKIPKATDLEQWFGLELSKVSVGDGKYLNGFRLREL